LRVPTFENLLQHFRSARGLYLLGAGASAGLAPIGHELYRRLALDWWRNGRGFPPDIGVHISLVERVIESQSNCPEEEIIGRSIRPGTPRFPFAEMLQRLPNGRAQLQAMRELTEEHYKNRLTDNYRVFRTFYPSVILNYNLDGLASLECGNWHRVIDIHGTIDPWFGSPGVEKLIAHELDVSFPTDGLILCEPEGGRELILRRRLAAAASTSPNFVAVIGYSFAKRSGSYDDYVSFEWFAERFRGFEGYVYVLDPSPEELQSAVAGALGSRRVFGVRAWWNVLSHAFCLHLCGRGLGRSIYATHEMLLSVYGAGCAFSSAPS